LSSREFWRKKRAGDKTKDGLGNKAALQASNQRLPLFIFIACLQGGGAWVKRGAKRSANSF